MATPKPMRPLRIGLSLMRAEELAGGSYSGVLELAQLADDMGVDEVHVSDHVAISRAGFDSKGGKFPYPIDYTGWYEPLASLSAIAAVTKRIRLSTNVLVATLRPAILLAKQLATLDVISKGRLDVAFGVGWQKEEFDASGIAFEGRYRYVEEQIGVCRALWGGAPASFEGERVRFKDFYSLPRPVQGANIPICLGVLATPHNVARIARCAEGWYPSALHGPAIIEGVAALRKAFEENGRDPDSLVVRTGLRMGRPFTMTMDEAFADGAPLIENGATIIVGQPQLVCRSTREWKPYIQRLLALKG
jgi:probable F420-dependent oxidoreductase